MSASKFPTPAIQMRLYLARRRALGWSFDVAFERSIVDLNMGDKVALAQWRSVIREERETWRRAYEREQMPPAAEALGAVDPAKV